MVRRLLIVGHVPSANTQVLRDAVLAGAMTIKHDDVEAITLSPFEAKPNDVISCSAIVLGTTENFGYMSGALKDFFDRIYYPCLEHTQGLPYALFIRAGQDGTGTRRSVEAIANGLRWRAVQPPLVCRGTFQPGFVDQCRELGEAIAAGLEAGIF